MTCGEIAVIAISTDRHAPPDGPLILNGVASLSACCSVCGRRTPNAEEKTNETPAAPTPPPPFFFFSPLLLQVRTPPLCPLYLCMSAC